MLNTLPRPKPKPTKGMKTKKRKKKTTRQLLVRDLDKIIREIVMMRDNLSVPLMYKAYTEIDDESGLETVKVSIKTNVPQLGHIISRARLSVRWDLRNCHKQDAGDNLMHEFYPEVYITWYINTFGLQSWEKLFNESRRLWKYSIDDLETLFIELTEIQKQQQNNLSWKPYYSQNEIMSGEWRKDFT